MEPVRIINYSPEYQGSIDQMMKGIEKEFPLPITSPQSTRINEVYHLEDQKFWLALHEQKVVGTIGLSLFSNGEAVLKRMMVDKAYRGKGFETASLLLTKALDWGKKEGYSKIYLGTMDQFLAAQKFYLKNGFKAITKDQLPKDYSPNPIDTLYYFKNLLP
ncbi:GNAT family N-acetyltransferase [Sphingobacteriaceae bacterium]|nr:GNAT family N-acetyltransferase [Sphingobacteriaceae bacterium]